MEGQRIFRITKDPYDVCQLIEKIPSSWHRVEGSLSASVKFIEARTVAVGMSMFLRRPYPNPITIIGVRKGSRAKNPDYRGVLHHGKLCQFIGFDVVGGGDLPLALVKRMIINYVRCGYTGHLLFFSKQCGDDKRAYPQLCEFRLTDWLPEGESDMEKAQPPSIFLKWKPQHGGNEVSFSKIVDLCEDLGFPEVRP